MADALDSGSSECKFMWVQVPSSAPRNREQHLLLSISLCRQGLEPGRGEPLRKHASGMFLGERSAEALRCNFAKRNCIKSRRPHPGTQWQASTGENASSPVVRIRKSRRPHGSSPVVIYLHLVHHTSLRFTRVIGRILHGKFLAEYVCNFHEWERFYG